MILKLLNNKYLGWLIMLSIIAYFTFNMIDQDKQQFLPGQTSSGHHQIELACDQCHTPLDGVKQEACLNCHGEALDKVSDSHAAKIFNDPRSYMMLEKIDAKQCVTCHAEHVNIQHNGKVASIPKDFCFACHDDIAEERVSHKDLSTESCGNSGCHNYHDNTDLYEDFILKHIDELDTSYPATVPLHNSETELPKFGLSALDQDSIRPSINQKIIDQWTISSHAKSAINCNHCHQPTDSTTGTIATWTDTPEMAVCTNCHQQQTDTFHQGKHGMRIAAGLSPMQPKQSRIIMKPEAGDKTLTCNICHSAHNYNIKNAAVEACLDCHDDTHSKSYKSSAHYKLWLKELSGNLPAGSGVSCATCHLPRLQIKQEGQTTILTTHNQNANLKPNSKMIRNVCMQCHGLAFSLQSLADKNLLLNNYSGKSLKPHKTIKMVKDRINKKPPTTNTTE